MEAKILEQYNEKNQNQAGIGDAIQPNDLPWMSLFSLKTGLKYTITNTT